MWYCRCGWDKVFSTQGSHLFCLPLGPALGARVPGGQTSPQQLGLLQPELELPLPQLMFNVETEHDWAHVLPALLGMVTA